MKTPLFLIFIFTSLLSFGQKRLFSKSEVKYNENGSIFTIDSTNYYYSNWYNQLSEFKPKFNHSWGFSYLMPDREPDYNVHCDSSVLFQSKSYPLNYNSTIRNVVSNGLLTESKVDADTEYNFDYNSGGLKTLSEKKYKELITDSTFFTYDSLGNSLTKTIHPFQGSNIPNYGPSFIDSSFYLPNTDLLKRRVTYKYNMSSATYEIADLWEINYIGSKINFIDHFRKGGNGGIYWYTRTKHSYLDNNFINRASYLIQGDSLFYIFDQEHFEYNFKNEMVKVVRTSGDVTDTSILTLLKYDADGFVEEINEYLNGFDGLFLVRQWKYQFEYKSALPENDFGVVILYPNPTSDFVHVRSESPIQSIQIYNLSGQLLSEQNMNEINLEHLSSAMYLVKVTTEKGIFLEKVSKR